MHDPFITPLVSTDCLDKRYSLFLHEKPGAAPQFKLKIFQLYANRGEPDLIRGISIRSRPAVDLAKAILSAAEDWEQEPQWARTARLSGSQS